MTIPSRPDDADARPRTALLWDLDNVTPRRAHLASFARALCCLVEPNEPVISAGHRVNFRTCRHLLAGLGFQVYSGGRGRNGADRILLREARTLADQGTRRFIVASHDHKFARIAALGELHVVSLSGVNISTALRAVAHSIWVMSLTERGWLRVPADASSPLEQAHEYRLAAEAWG